jgi:hypothetical protein
MQKKVWQRLLSAIIDNSGSFDPILIIEIFGKTGCYLARLFGQQCHRLETLTL